MTGQIVVGPLPSYKDVEPSVYVGLLSVPNENHNDFLIDESTGWVM